MGYLLLLALGVAGHLIYGLIHKAERPENGKLRHCWGDFGGGGDEPQVPTWSLPTWAEGLPEEIKQYIMQGVGKTLTEPSEYGLSSTTLQNLLNYVPQLTQLQEPSEYGQVSQGLQGLLGYTPEQFAYPMEDIQKALAAQQELQMDQYLKQIRPTLAAQGQLDSTYYTTLVNDFIKNQQAQTYGTTADLLTNQATQNYNLQQWLPQYKANVLTGLQNIGTARSGINQYNTELQNALQQWIPEYQSTIAQALQGLGTARSGIQQYNLQYPYSTYIPAMSSLYGQGMQQGNQEYQSALNQYNAAMQKWQQEEAEKQQAIQAAMMVGGMALGGFAGGAGFAGLAGGSQGAMQGALLGGSFGSGVSPLFGGSGGGLDLGTALNYAYPQSNVLQLDFSGLAGLGGTTIPTADASSIYKTNFKLPSLSSRYNQYYGYQ